MVKQPIHSTINFVKSVFSGKETRPKIPRKKLEIQFAKATQQMQQQTHKLADILETSSLNENQRKVGQQLLDEVTRFTNYQIYQMSEVRLRNLQQQLVHPVDFSMFVLYRIYSFTEQLFHFIHTIKVKS